MKSLFKFFAAGADQPRLTDASLIDEKFRYYRRNVIVVAILCYGLGYVCRLALNVVKKPLMDAGVFTPEEMGFIGSMLLYGYAVGKFSNGLLSDYANVKRFFAVGLFLSAMMNFGMSFSSVVWLSALFWVLNGWFQGFGAPSCAVALANWYSNSERGRYYGLWSTAHAIGEGLTYLGIALLHSCRHYPKMPISTHTLPRRPIFLNTAAGILGCVTYGFLSDKWFNARRPPANLLFGLMEVLPLFVIFYGPTNNTVLAVALVVYGFGLSGILASLGGLFAIDIAPKKVAGAAMGFIGIFSYIGAGTQDYISGKLIYDSEMKVIFSMGDSSLTVFFYDYSTPILFWIGASVVSMVLAGSLWKVRASD
ncbi:MAG: MFS transporter [Proteobacteria bacterium]|nr:MFS transporter [Pseudomonadota bacterium]